MDDTRSGMEQAVVAMMHRLSVNIPRQSMDRWLAVDLSTAQLKTLAVLTRHEAMTVGGVAETLGITLPTASHLVDRLVRAGYAERHDDPLDRRRAVVRPSGAGTALIRGLQEFNQTFLRSCLARMNDGDVAALLRGLHAFADAAEADITGGTDAPHGASTTRPITDAVVAGAAPASAHERSL